MKVNLGCLFFLFNYVTGWRFFGDFCRFNLGNVIDRGSFVVIFRRFIEFSGERIWAGYRVFFYFVVGDRGCEG